MQFLRGKGCAAGGRVALALALALALVAPSEAQRSGAAVASMFAEPRTALELRRRICALDADELPALFRVVAEGGVTDPEAGFRPLDDASRQVARDALAARPRRELAALLEDLARRPQPDSARLEALRLLGGLGNGDHLKLLVRLAVPAQERGPVAPEMRAGFTEALNAMLGRDPAALEQ